MNWNYFPLEKISIVTGGSTPNRGNPQYWKGSIHWVTPSDLSTPGSSIININKSNEMITELGLKSSTINLLPPGSVLFSSRATIGKIGIADIPLTTNQGFANFIPNKDLIDSKYLAYSLQYYTPQISLLAGSTTFKEVRRGLIKKFEIPLPSKSEQNKIVKILDQASALRKKRAEADKIAESIIPALFYKMFGDPYFDWKNKEKTSISSLITKIKRRNPAEHPKEYFKYIDISGIDGKLGKIIEYKTLSGSLAPSRARQILEKNDIIISTVRPYLKATALLSEFLDNQIGSTGFCVLRLKCDYGYGYLYALSRVPWFTQKLNLKSRGASYPAVTDKDIKSLEVVFPKEKSKLILFDEKINQLINIQEQRILSANKIETLFSVFLNTAFDGKLTETWRQAHMKELLQEMEIQAKYLNEA